MKTLFVCLAILVLSACSSTQKQHTKIPEPTYQSPQMLCTTTLQTLCMTVGVCDTTAQNVFCDQDTVAEVCSQVTHIRDEKALTNICLPWLEELKHEECETVINEMNALPDECLDQLQFDDTLDLSGAAIPWEEHKSNTFWTFIELL